MTLTPSRAWGGEGALGCVLGYGALHRLPPPLSEPVNAPGEMMFDGGELNEKTPYGAGFQGADPASFVTPADQAKGQQDPTQTAAAGGGEFLVPAQMASAPPPTNAPPRSHKKKANRAAGGGIDDYFNEQEQKSRELDRPETTRSKSPLAPPPKAGGPPKGGPPKAESPAEPAEGGDAAA